MKRGNFSRILNSLKLVKRFMWKAERKILTIINAERDKTMDWSRCRMYGKRRMKVIK